MFAGGFFAKTFFTGYYFAPVDGGSVISSGDVHVVGMHVNVGVMMGRM